MNSFDTLSSVSPCAMQGLNLRPLQCQCRVPQSTVCQNTVTNGRFEVLVGCEFSATVRQAFRERGYDAWSCDLLASHGQHIQDDIIKVVRRGGKLAILHPPCTAITVAGNRTYSPGGKPTPEREKAISWTIYLWEESVKYFDSVALENPIGVLSTRWRKPTQIIQPWQYGHGETKATCLWLQNLPSLHPTKVVSGRQPRIWKMPPSADRGKLRSITYQGIAEAMASQWGLFL